MNLATKESDSLREPNQIKKIEKNTWLRFLRVFTLSIGTTAVLMLSVAGTLGLRQGKEQPQAMEASVFNGEKTFDASLPVTTGEVSAPQAVIPLGSVFGIKLFTDGLIVASLSDVYAQQGPSCPAAQAGLQPGDYVLEANGTVVKNNASLAKIIAASEGKEVMLKVKRNNTVFEAGVTPVYADGSFKTGMWVRDSAAGIGTLTFYNPETGVFAGLGHGICDMDTSGVMTLRSGEPAPITLCGIQKGEPNEPGQLRGYFTSDESLGTLYENNETGVYGKLSNPPTGPLLPVMDKEEVQPGEVEILASIDGEGPRYYKGQIEKIIGKDRNTKNFVVSITDPLLLERTGGIVQGMSGCPIIQNGELVGAITHVYTETPTTGYGIFAQVMLEESGTFGVSE